jgi:hypothetical protein
MLLLPYKILCYLSTSDKPYYRGRLQLHKPLANFTSYWRGVYYASMKTFNVLPMSVAELVTNKKHFIITLKEFLIDKSFYSIDEYFNY